jgi:hypothetical protein
MWKERNLVTNPIARQTKNYVSKGRAFTGGLNQPTEKDGTNLQVQNFEDDAVVLDHDIGLRRPGDSMKEKWRNSIQYIQCSTIKKQIKKFTFHIQKLDSLYFTKISIHRKCFS